MGLFTSKEKIMTEKLVISDKKYLPQTISTYLMLLVDASNGEGRISIDKILIDKASDGVQSITFYIKENL